MSPAGVLTRMRLLAPARGERPWHSSILHAMRVVTAGLVVMDGITGLSTSAPILGQGALVWLGLGVACAAVIAMAVLLVGGVEDSGWHVAAVVLLLAGLTLGLAITWHEASSSPIWWPTRFLTAAIMFVVVAGRSRQRAPLLLLLALFHVGMRSIAWAKAGVPWSEDLVRQLAGELGLYAFSAGVMFVIVETMLRAGQLTDDAHAAAVREKRRAADAQATERSAREVQRFVHDEVLHALRVVAMDRRAVGAEAAVTAAVRLDRLLHETPATAAEGDTFVERLENAVQAIPLRVEVTADPGISVPADVEAALLLATMEALRNVQLHSGASRARVRAWREGLQVRVEVTDEGVGFDTTALTSTWGVRSSIHQRMREVGGNADITSRPGAGTTVTLAWTAGLSPVSPRFAASIGFGALADLYPRASLITLPYFAFTLWNAAWLSPDLAAPWAGWAAAVILTAVAAPIALATLLHGPRTWMAVVLIAVAWGTTALNGWALPAGVTSPYLLWAGTSALAVVVPLTMFHHPALIALAGLGAAAIAGGFTVARAGAELAASAFLPTIVQPAVSVAAYVAVRIALDSLAWEIYRTGEESARAQAEARTRAEFVTALAARMRRQRDVIAAFVHDVATGVLDPRDATVRARADALERMSRDIMVSRFATSLPEVAATMRSDGHAVSVRVAEEAPASPQIVGAGALRLVAAASPPGTRADVTLTVMPLAAAWRVAMTVVDPDPLLAVELSGHEREGWVVARDPDFIHLSRHVPSKGDIDAFAAR